MASRSMSVADGSSKKRALVIGNDNYSEGSKLRYCINNARDIGERLQRIDFTVNLGIDLICEEMDRTIEVFLHEVCSGDLVVFFFSGYGIHWNDQNFLLPIDNDHIRLSQALEHRTINLQNILQMINARRPSACIFLLDCSRNYTVTNEGPTRTTVDCGGLCAMEALNNVLITFACDAKKTVTDKSTNGWNTIFVSHLVKYLTEPNILLDEMVDIIADEIMTETNEQQCLFKVSSIKKNLYLNYQMQTDLSQRRNSRLEQSIAQFQNHSLVDLRNLQLIDRDIKTIIQQVVVNKQCAKLWLGGNRITSVGASILASALNHNTVLERLYLQANRLSDIGVKYLSQTLSNNNNVLQVLALEDNGITDMGVDYLSDMLRTNTTLTGLWLENNLIGDRGVRLLCNVLQSSNSTLQYLDLSKNRRINDLSLDAIQSLIENSRGLNELSIYQCNLSKTAKEKLKKLVKSKKNFSIYLNTWNE